MRSVSSPSSPTPQNQNPEKLKQQSPLPCEWDFTLASVVSSPTNCAASDTLGVLEFDPSDSLIATAGIARKIRGYRLHNLLPQDIHHNATTITQLDHSRASDFCICTPAKLSSLRWKPNANARILGSGDYDGVVTEYDLEMKVPIFERDEHGGRRVWSVDYSTVEPVVGASGSDDGTVQVWDTRCESGECVAVVQPSVVRSPVCCVEFNPYGGGLVAVGCADRKAYGYDRRKMREPVVVFEGHGKTVTYVKFVDGGTVVSASTDGSLKMWKTEEGGGARVVRTYEGHVNGRSFVGLSVWRKGGLIGCGSEDKRVFVYDKRWGEPIWVKEFDGGMGSGYGLVSSVCWRQVGEQECTLVAGGSDGVLQVFVGHKKRSF
ncbi:WD repeat-containing protein RUP2-like [Cucumis melo var. makuwa]|uniref:WD repeat-containing protein RUP2-like n=2 Tax=Cucumis melo TaxID=3656 RepID=A0A5A7T553_CUCMM|nr:WD repeat-containing protein RUP2-like [Cucumis melo var. makuwa]